MNVKVKFNGKKLTHAMFVAPSLALYTFFSILPILLGIYYSFTNWNGIARKYKFIGLDNYKRMLSDARFLRAVRFNVKYAAMLIVCIVLLSLVMGMMLNRNIPGKSFFRAAYFFPAVISLITSGLIFNQIYGYVLPELGKMAGIGLLGKNILASPKTAIFGILITHVWQGTAVPTVLIMAGLQTVPEELKEAAMLDGATPFQVFRYITLPFLLPVISMILVLVLKDGLMVYDYILTLTTGGPAGATESITMLLFRQGFEEMKFSYAISQAITAAVVIIAVSVMQISFTNRKKVY
ncbi:sugar ABC transporter permease [Clostridium sp. AM58-1XD]|uniref:carbohydrate ABC transporter permease n=1 Tax=Clostridium sp. AM58-1XD TaxID=2292307 RepID=UPI000E4988E1|nr:sugar ABC transporter permease [Clostridium sp. AM58-1XD]RGY97504.1 sugar ABC transporter permease [Clostridium sp. AM58-1XD]